MTLNETQNADAIYAPHDQKSRISGRVGTNLMSTSKFLLRFQIEINTDCRLHGISNKPKQQVGKQLTFNQLVTGFESCTTTRQSLRLKRE